MFNDDKLINKIKFVRSIIKCMPIEKESPWTLQKKKKLLLMSPVMLQGGWEDDESIDEAACREAFEEAGVKGNISVGALTYS